MTRTPARWRAQRAADVHQARRVDRGADLRARVEHVAQLVAEHRHRGVRVLDRERAAEAAALARLVQSTRSIPRTARSSRAGRSPTPQRADRVARRVQRDPVRERRPDVLDAEHVDDELRQLVDRRAGERHAHALVVVAHEPDAGRARGDDGLRVPEHALRSAAPAAAPRPRSPSCRASARSRSARAGSPRRSPSRSSSATVARPASGKSVSLKQVMNSATRTASRGVCHAATGCTAHRRGTSCRDDRTSGGCGCTSRSTTRSATRSGSARSSRCCR